MKFRTDFVTNSSSSSFLSVDIKSKTLYNIVEGFKKELLENEYIPFLELKDKNRVYFDTEDGWEEMPYEKEDIMSLFIRSLDIYGYIDENYDNDGKSVFHIKEENEDDEYREELSPNYKVLYAILQSVINSLDKIKEDMEYAELIEEQYGWGGDDDSRYDRGTYSEERLGEIYEEIKRIYGVEKDTDITDDMFCDYVGDKTSVSSERSVYNKDNSEELVTEYDYYLED